MSRLQKTAIYLSPLWSGLLLLGLLTVLDPVMSGPGGVLTVFIAIYVFIASIFFIVLHLVVGLVVKAMNRRRRAVTTRPFQISMKRAYYMASILAFGPVLLLALNSVRQLQVVDILLVVVFLFLAIFYIAKREA